MTADLSNFDKRWSNAHFASFLFCCYCYVINNKGIVQLILFFGLQNADKVPSMLHLTLACELFDLCLFKHFSPVANFGYQYLCASWSEDFLVFFTPSSLSLIGLTSILKTRILFRLYFCLFSFPCTVCSSMKTGLSKCLDNYFIQKNPKGVIFHHIETIHFQNLDQQVQNSSI